jgi:ComEC/Rec2-related protein
MIAEREIAGFVLPFTIGIIAAAVLSHLFHTQSIALAAASVIPVSTSVLLLIHPCRHRWGNHFIVFLLLAASAGCGLLTGFTHSLSSMDSPHRYSAISELFTQMGEPLISGIEKIPFKDIATNRIIAALVAGEKSAISSETISVFRESGASHILALSGLHLGIIYGILIRLLSFLGHGTRANKVRAFLIIASCGLYTMITGAGASITRAFLFILIREMSKLYNRYQSTAQTLMGALFLQLLISPGSVRDIGFQLSYAAMAGIAYIFPWLKSLWPEGKGGIIKWVWISASLSLACQITTGPLAYFYFGTFPTHFLLTNLIAMPLTGLIIPLSLLTLVLNYAGLCPGFMTGLTERLVNLMNDALSIVASM